MEEGETLAAAKRSPYIPENKANKNSPLTPNYPNYPNPKKTQGLFLSWGVFLARSRYVVEKKAA